MNTTKTENEKITIEYIQWLGFENTNGAFTREGFAEIQYHHESFWYCEGKNHKELLIEKDLSDIVIPVLNAEIQKRNRELNP